MNSILVSERLTYGKITYYPACDKAKVFARMLNQKTLTADNLRDIKDLGFTITLYLNELPNF